MAAKRKIMVPYPVLKEGLTELFERYEVYYPNRIVPRNEILEILPQYDALISCGFLANAEAIERMDNVKIMSTYGVGYDNVDLKKMNEKGILVCNLPDIVTESTAEFAMGLMLALMRRIPETDHKLRLIPDLMWLDGSRAGTWYYNHIRSYHMSLDAAGKLQAKSRRFRASYQYH